MSLICALSIQNGFYQLVSRSIFSLTPDLWVYDKNETTISDLEAAQNRIKNTPDVTTFAPYAERKGVIKVNDINLGVTICGIDPTREKQLTSLHTKLVNGSYFYEDSTEDSTKVPSIILSATVAAQYHLDIDSEIILMTLTMDADSNPVPSYGKFVIRGLFNSYNYDAELHYVYINITSAQKLFEMIPGSIQCYRARLKDPFRYKKTYETLSRDFYVERWVDRAGLLFTSMKMEKTVLIVAFSTIILMGIQGLSGTVRLLFLSKKRQIGILSALGMRNPAIRQVFFINGLLRGTLSSFAGIMIGLFLYYFQKIFGFVKLPYDIFIINYVPVELKMIDVFFIFTGTVAASGIISFLSSRQVTVPNQYFREIP